MRTVLTALVAYLALYLVVWLHEVGHAIGYAYYGCKKNWLHVNVKPYIFFSTPGAIDVKKAQNLTPRQIAAVTYGGIISNLLWTVFSLVCISLAKNLSEWMVLFLWVFCTLHMAEMVSYLFIGDIYLVSDMAIIASLYPQLRMPNLAAGMVLTVIYVLTLLKVPSDLFGIVLLWNISTVLGMCGGRIVFSELNKNRR